ncbi:amidohydrolase family protein [Mycobacterium sp. NPDC003449]
MTDSAPAGQNIEAVDVHAHLWISDVQDLVAGLPGFIEQRRMDERRAGRDSNDATDRMVRQRRCLLTSLERRIAHMDANGVAAQVVSVVPTQYHSWADRVLAWEIAAATNAGIAGHCGGAAGRLTGLGVAPLQHPEVAIRSLEDAVLRHGLRGVEVPTFAAGMAGTRPIDLSSRTLDGFWSRAEELGAIIFVHPWGCSLDERLDRWYLSNSVGQPVEHAVAVSHLVVGGVLDRHPGLILAIAHGGGYLPALMTRVDHAWTHRADARGCAQLPSSYLDRMYFDSLVYTPRALDALVATVGHRQVLLGSDYPFDMGVEDPVAALVAADLSADATQAIAFTNADRLGLTPPR